MAFFGLFKRKGYDFDDKDREVALELRQTRAELKRLTLEREAELANLRYQKQKESLLNDIAELRGEDDEDEGNGDISQALLLKLLNPLINSSPSAAGNPTTINPPAALHISNEQIKITLDGVDKKFIKIAKKMDNEALKMFIKGQMPSLDEDSLNRAVLMIKEY